MPPLRSLGAEPKEVSGEEVESPRRVPWGARALWAWGLAAAFACAAASLLASALMVAVKSWRAAPLEERAFDFLSALRRVVLPGREWTGWIDLLTAVVFGLMGGLAVAATLAARGRPGKQPGRAEVDASRGE